MKRYLRILFYTIVLSLSFFACFNFGVSAKIKLIKVKDYSTSRNVFNTIDETNEEIDRIEKERLER